MKKISSHNNLVLLSLSYEELLFLDQLLFEAAYGYLKEIKKISLEFEVDELKPLMNEIKFILKQCKPSYLDGIYFEDNWLLCPYCEYPEETLDQSFTLECGRCHKRFYNINYQIVWDVNEIN